MHGAQAGRTPQAGRLTGSGGLAGAAHQGLAGPNGSAIKRLAGSGGGTPWAGRAWRHGSGWGRARLLFQTLKNILTRRNNGAGGGLTRQAGARAGRPGRNGSTGGKTGRSRPGRRHGPGRHGRSRDGGGGRQLRGSAGSNDVRGRLGHAAGRSGRRSSWTGRRLGKGRRTRRTLRTCGSARRLSSQWLPYVQSRENRDGRGRAGRRISRQGPRRYGDIAIGQTGTGIMSGRCERRMNGGTSTERRPQRPEGGNRTLGLFGHGRLSRFRLL